MASGGVHCSSWLGGSHHREVVGMCGTISCLCQWMVQGTCPSVGKVSEECSSDSLGMMKNI